MKKSIVAIVSVVVLIGIVSILSRNDLSNSASGSPNLSQGNNGLGNQANPTLIPTVKASGEVNAEGYLVPNQSVSLSLNVSGVVEKVLVSEGQTVKQGDILIQMRNQAQIQASIAEAKLEVVNAEKSLVDLNNNAKLLAAQYKLDITQAVKDLEDAKNARNYLSSNRATPAKIEELNTDIKYANDKVNQLQELYNSPSGKTAEVYDMLKQAKADRDELVRRLAYLSAPPTKQEIDEADAKLTLAQFKYDDLKRKIEIFSQGPDPAEVNVAQARIDNAKAQLVSAQDSLTQLELRAPFDGTIVKLSIKAGEYVTLGMPIITLADFSIWRIETNNLTELSVTQIKEGNPVVINFDAIPGESFDGKVAYISKLGEARQGEMNYKVVIEVTQSDPRFRWNMTSPVVIRPKD